MTGPGQRPTPARSNPFRVHVERTQSDRVLRWVCRRVDLIGDVSAPAGSALAEMVSVGELHAALGRDGDLLVDFGTASHAQDPHVVARVHEAIVEALTTDPWEATRSETLIPAGSLTVRRRTAR